LSLARRFKDLWFAHAFGRAVERYRAERLGPGLGVERLGEPLKAERRRRVYLVETTNGPGVLKLHFRRPKHLRNALEAQRLFEAAEIPVPRVLFEDVSAETKAAYGLCCVVQEWIDGEAYDRRRLPSLPRVAALLARLHRRLGPRCGYLARPAGADLWGDFLERRLDRALAQIAAAPLPGFTADAEGVRRWFLDWRGAAGQGLGGFSPLHGDLQTGNVRFTPEERIYFIDLDNGYRALYGLEWIRVALTFALSREEAKRIAALADFWTGYRDRLSPVEAAYFAELPQAFAEDWRRSRDFYLAWGLLGRVASSARRARKKGVHGRPTDVRARAVEEASDRWRRLARALRETAPRS